MRVYARACVTVSVCGPHICGMQESEYHFPKLFISFHNVSPGGQAHVARLGGKHFDSSTQKGNFNIWFLHLLNEEANEAFLTRLREDDLKSHPNKLLAYPCNLRFIWHVCVCVDTIATSF